MLYLKCEEHMLDTGTFLSDIVVTCTQNRLKLRHWRKKSHKGNHNASHLLKGPIHLLTTGADDLTL